MIKTFDTVEKYNTYTNNGANLKSGILYYIREDNSAHWFTSEIDGELKKYDTNGGKIPEGYIIPKGNKTITANGANIDVAQYATVSVNVPSSTEGKVLGSIIDKTISAIEIPNGITSIENRVFKDCKNLTNVIIPDSVTTIGDYAFYGCDNLTNITIGNGITYIGNNAFYSVKSVILTITAITPPTLGDEAIGCKCCLKDIKIYVPEESLEAYKSARGWAEFSTKIEAISD